MNFFGKNQTSIANFEGPPSPMSLCTHSTFIWLDNISKISCLSCSNFLWLSRCNFHTLFISRIRYQFFSVLRHQKTNFFFHFFFLNRSKCEYCFFIKQYWLCCSKVSKEKNVHSIFTNFPVEFVLQTYQTIPLLKSFQNVI